jgi:hypothetical protein
VFLLISSPSLGCTMTAVFSQPVFSFLLPAKK